MACECAAARWVGPILKTHSICIAFAGSKQSNYLLGFGSVVAEQVFAECYTESKNLPMA
jgi:hypothetical protein